MTHKLGSTPPYGVGTFGTSNTKSNFSMRSFNSEREFEVPDSNPNLPHPSPTSILGYNTDFWQESSSISSELSVADGSHTLMCSNQHKLYLLNHCTPSRNKHYGSGTCYILISKKTWISGKIKVLHFTSHKEIFSQNSGSKKHTDEKLYLSGILWQKKVHAFV